MPQFSDARTCHKHGKILAFLLGETEAQRLKLSQDVKGAFGTAMQVSGFQSPKEIGVLSQ